MASSHTKRFSLLPLTLMLVLAFPALADSAPQRIREVLSEQVPQLRVNDIRETDMDGIYEVRTAQETLYVSSDGQHAFVGTMLRFDDSEGIINVTERGRSGERREALAEVSMDEMIVFSPESETRAELYVFTDIDCGYCRKLHRNMDALNDMGIQVNYLSFPRGGPGSQGYKKAINAWCADDPGKAITQAKQGEAIPDQNCDHPVDKHFQLGQSLGVSGTPAIVTEEGRMIPGFRPPEELARMLGLEG